MGDIKQKKDKKEKADKFVLIYYSFYSFNKLEVFIESLLHGRYYSRQGWRGGGGGDTVIPK